MMYLVGKPSGRRRLRSARSRMGAVRRGPGRTPAEPGPGCVQTVQTVQTVQRLRPCGVGPRRRASGAHAGARARAVGGWAGVSPRAIVTAVTNRGGPVSRRPAASRLAGDRYRASSDKFSARARQLSFRSTRNRRGKQQQQICVIMDERVKKARSKTIFFFF